MEYCVLAKLNLKKYVNFCCAERFQIQNTFEF